MTHVYWQPLSVVKPPDNNVAKGRYSAELEKYGYSGVSKSRTWRLRTAHLAAHIETRALLSRAQVAHYHALRGYAVPTSAAGHDGGHHGGD